MARKNQQQKTINLALQGGGSHGAFAWGVLDKLLEDGRIDIEGLCATSAGTMNACAYAYGKYVGGPEKAREVLHDFWYGVHKAGQKYSPVKRMPWENMLLPSGERNWNMNGSFSYFMFDMFTRIFSPYQFNPFDFNPLKDVLENTIDFEQLKKCDCTKLFISATHVGTGKVRVFNAHEMDIDVALASACLPYLFKAVEIDGQHYWDGGYMGNPPLFPFFHGSPSDDIVIVQINPIVRPGLPRSAQDIQDRVSEITFNSALLHELRAIDFVCRLLDDGKLQPGHYRAMKVHMIEARRRLRPLGASSKLNAEWAFLQHLFEIGRDAASRWLVASFDDLGVQSTVDLRGMFQGVGVLPSH